MRKRRIKLLNIKYIIAYNRRRQPTARVPNVARGTIFNGTLSELKCSILYHKRIFNFLLIFVFVPIYIKVLNNLQRNE
jgi:hypothetical protein